MLYSMIRKWFLSGSDKRVVHEGVASPADALCKMKTADSPGVLHAALFASLMLALGDRLSGTCLQF